MVQVDFGITDLAVVTSQVETALTPDETVVEVFGALMILVVEFSQDDAQFFLSSDTAPLLAVVSVLVDLLTLAFYERFTNPTPHSFVTSISTTKLNIVSASFPSRFFHRV